MLIVGRDLGLYTLMRARYDWNHRNMACHPAMIKLRTWTSNEFNPDWALMLAYDLLPTSMATSVDVLNRPPWKHAREDAKPPAQVSNATACGQY